MKQEELKQTTPTGGVPLAIIGIGCLFPQAGDSSAYWANIREGIDSITDIPATHWSVKDYHDQNPKSPDMTYGQRGGFLSEVPFNPMEFNIPPATLEAIDTSQLLGLVAAGQALKDAGFDVKFAVASSDGYLPVTVVKGVGTFYNTDEEVYADTPNGEGEEIECDGPSVVAWAKRCNGPVRESSSKVLSILCEEDQGPRAACGTR